MLLFCVMNLAHNAPLRTLGLMLLFFVAPYALYIKQDSIPLQNYVYDLLTISLSRYHVTAALI